MTTERTPGVMPPPPQPAPPAPPPPPPPAQASSVAKRLDEVCLYTNSTDTSQAAAAREMSSGRTHTKARIIYDHIASQGDFGSCDFETQNATGLPLETICGCRGSLKNKGLVIDSGRTRVKPTTGNATVVWVAVLEGV